MAGGDEPVKVERERNVANGKLLNQYAKENREALGLDPDLPVQPFSYHPVHRIGPNGRLCVDFVVEYLQQRPEPINPNVPGSLTFSFRGGSTVLFDDRGEVRYVIKKSIANRGRLVQQQKYHLEQLRSPASAPYVVPTELPNQVNFQLVHRGR